MLKDEISKVEAYLCKTFGTKKLSVRPSLENKDSAKVYINDNYIADLQREEEDGELSYQFEMAVEDEAHLIKTLGTKNLTVRPRPKKDDSAEVYIGEEFIAVLYREEKKGKLSYQFQMAILDIDIEGSE